eukprot:gene56521-6610_t
MRDAWRHHNRALDAYYASNFDTALRHIAEGRATLRSDMGVAGAVADLPLLYDKLHTQVSLRPADPRARLEEVHLTTDDAPRAPAAQVDFAALRQQEQHETSRFQRNMDDDLALQQQRIEHDSLNKQPLPLLVEKVRLSGKQRHMEGDAK